MEMMNVLVEDMCYKHAAYSHILRELQVIVYFVY